MYLFTRSRRIRAGSFGQGIEWSVAATESVRKITGREVNAWAAVLSPEVGTVTWSMWTETVADVIEAGDKLATSSTFNDLVQRGDEHFEGPLQDGLANLLFGAPDADAGPPEYVNVVTATAAPGRLADAVAGGVALAEHASKVSGADTMFLVNATGLYGGVAWISSSADVAAVDAGRAALMADPEWLGLVDRHGTAFSMNAAQSIFRRIA